MIKSIKVAFEIQQQVRPSNEENKEIEIKRILVSTALSSIVESIE